jgi:putative Mn2+ efflux pump MntP
MDLISVVLIAFGLAIDAFTVSVTYGISITNTLKNALKIALSFGIFQAVMPIVGWLAGLTVVNFVEKFSHWITFCILCCVGIKMIYESRKSSSFLEGGDKSCIDNYKLFLLAIATSIDALAIGFAFAFLEITIAFPILIIGLITFILSVVGFSIGDKLTRLFGKRVEVIAGVVLIGVGIRILLKKLV